jgi:uncharacterized repeat protein (TIGR01451 family)
MLLKRIKQMCMAITVLVFCACPPYDFLDASSGKLTVQEALGYKSDDPYMAVVARSKHYQFPDSYYFYDGLMYGANGNEDGLLNPGETVIYEIGVANYGKKPAQGVSVVISTGDSYISDIKNASGFISSFNGRDRYSPDARTIFNYNKEKNLRFTVSPNTPPGHIIKFDIVFSDAHGNTWRDYFLLTVS